MIEIAKILKPVGIRGEVRVRLFSENLKEFSDRGFVYIKKDADFSRINYKTIRIEPPFIVLRIEGVDTRNDAEEYKASLLYIDRNELSDTEEGEHYIIDLLGLEVNDTKGNKLGILKDILQHGAADVYVVKGEKGFMFPALKRVIKNVDLKKRVITIDAEALSEVAVYDDV